MANFKFIVLAITLALSLFLNVILLTEQKMDLPIVLKTSTKSTQLLKTTTKSTQMTQNATLPSSNYSNTQTPQIFVTDKVLNCTNGTPVIKIWNSWYKEKLEMYPGCDVEQNLKWIASLKKKESRTFSQNGEDGITIEIFQKIGHGKKFFVEFGVEDGQQCNSRILREKFGWRGVTFDGTHAENLKIPQFNRKMFVDNVVKNFAEQNISRDIDFLSVDTDFSDFWLIQKIFDAGYKARVLVIEFNRNFGPYASLTVPYFRAKSHTFWSGNNYFGASALAFTKLLNHYGYNLIHIDANGVNLFFVHKDEFLGMDFALAAWVEKLSDGTNNGNSLHPEDKANTPYQHVCSSRKCDNSFYW